MTASRTPPDPVSLTTPIIDCEPPPVGITACPPPSPAATLRRVRLRMVEGDEENQAEVFGSYTRGPRSLAIAARIELHRDRWRIVALQLG